MTRRWNLAAPLAVALLVSCLDVGGWWCWRTTAQVPAREPDTGARRLIETPGLALPEAVRRSRRLAARDLAPSAPDLVVGALERLGGLQRAWFHFDQIGWRNDASAAMIAGRLGDASILLDAALRRDPTSPLLHRLRALVRWTEGRHDAALDDLAEAAALAPSLRAPRMELTPEDSRWVRIEGLERALERAIELEPDVPEHAVRLVDFQIRNGEYMEATMTLSRALDRFPTEPRLLRQLERLHQDVVR